MLKNLMEEKQLDFNAPLMSVRRFASSANHDKTEGGKVVKFVPKRSSLPFHKPELKSGPIRDAGSVPFMWEQIPGRPKESGRPPPLSPDASLLAPKLPPGRTVDARQKEQQQQQKKQREQLRQQQQQTSLRHTENNSLEVPTVRKPIENKSHGNHVTAVVRSKQSLQDVKRTPEEDCDDAFSDALETLSRSESIFMNCSVSGLSALDGPDRKPFGNMFVDREARDFMMDRFLPAAKAMTAEAPQYATRKPASARDPTRTMNIVNRERRPVSYPYRHVVESQQNTDEDEESDNDFVDYDHSGYLSAKGCGLLPRFCLKSSSCLLNPIPGMRNRALLPPAGSKDNGDPKASSSHKSSNEDDEHSWEAVYKHKLVHGLQSHEAPGNRSRPTSESNRLSWSDSQTPDGSSPRRRSAGEAISPYRNDAPQSPFHEGTGFLGIPKQIKNMKGDALDTDSRSQSWGIVKFQDTSRQGSGSSSPAVEKTLYVDSVQVLDTPKSLSSSDTKDLMSPTCKDHETVMDNQEMEKCSVLAAQLSIEEQNSLQPKLYGIVEKSLQPRSIPDAEKEERVFYDTHLVTEKMLTCSTHSDGSLDQKNALASSLQGLLPPPLPKSPSESWLWRTLPSVPSKAPSSGSYLGVQLRSRKQVVRTSTADPKWENLVKNTKALRSQTRFSEELNKSFTEQ